MIRARLASLWRFPTGMILQSVTSFALRVPLTGAHATGEELRPFFGPLWALMPSILDKAFKGEL